MVSIRTPAWFYTVIEFAASLLTYISPTVITPPQCGGLMVVSHPRGGHGHRLFSLKFTIIFILVCILLTLVEFIIIAFGIKDFLVAYVLLY